MNASIFIFTIANSLPTAAIECEDEIHDVLQSIR
jgi:hypothetical protein